MGDRELDSWIAENLMGWKPVRMRGSPLRSVEHLTWISPDGIYYGGTWSPTTDHNDAARMRGRIAELELKAEFERELARAIGADLATYCYGFWCMQASPRQQCEAAKAAWEARKG